LPAPSGSTYRADETELRCRRDRRDPGVGRQRADPVPIRRAEQDAEILVDGE
jgi:hypothetical protein